MTAILTDRQLDECLLRSLCHTDTTAWCFIPLGESRITRMSSAFLKLWNLPELLRADRFSGADLRSKQLSDAFRSLGLSIDVLLDISMGGRLTAEESRLLVRTDGIQVRFDWIPVLTDAGLPAGRLVRFSTEIQEQVHNQLLQRVREATRRLQVLSPRERQVMDLLYEGNTNRRIAELTEISEKTVEKHRSRIMQKLHLSSGTQLIRLIAQARCLDDGPVSNSHPAHFNGPVGFSFQPPTES